MPRDFRQLLAQDHVVLFDGAMGTQLYAKGVFINRSFDELTLKEPQLVQEVHREYLKAGAEVIETNTYAANRAKLAGHGLQDQVNAINARAACLAREVAGEQAFVAGAMGPLGLRIEPYGPTSREEAGEMFAEQARGLIDGGVDLIVLETFSDLDEILTAIRAIRAFSDVPLVAQMTIQTDGNTAYGTSPAAFTAALHAEDVDVIGLNCSVGPHVILAAIEQMAAVTDKRLSAMPNAGLPREVEGRTIYMTSPDYMAKYAKRLIQAGVKVIGGCCGTTPEHIRIMGDAVRALSPRQAGAVSVVERELPAVQPVPVAERSRFAARLAAGEFLTSVEMVPPKGCEAKEFLAGASLLHDAGVDAVNVPDGPRAQSRMGAMAASLLLQQQVGIEAVVHYTCRDRNLLGMQSDLLGAAVLGLNNMLLVTGDPPKMGPYPNATAVFDIDSIGLTNMVHRLNQGLDLGGNPIGRPTSFLIGVGVNPCAVDLDHELRRFEYKVQAGAQYAITQPMFDLVALERFLDRIEGFRIPILVGIWPLVSHRNAEFLANEVPGIEVPPEVLARMKRPQDKDAAVAEGIAIAREMLTAIRGRVQGVQVNAPFGRVPLALEVLRDLTPVGQAR